MGQDILRVHGCHVGVLINENAHSNVMGLFSESGNVALKEMTNHLML